MDFFFFFTLQQCIAKYVLNKKMIIHNEKKKDLYCICFIYINLFIYFKFQSHKICIKITRTNDILFIQLWHLILKLKKP
jgi:hypothetical protein